MILLTHAHLDHVSGVERAKGGVRCAHLVASLRSVSL